MILSINVLLPRLIERRLRRWTDRSIGASWPAWGGHITILPAFTSEAGIDRVVEHLKLLVSCVDPFLVHLAQPLAVEDVTRPGYQAVFLTFGEEYAVGRREIEALRHSVHSELAPLRQDLRPELTDLRFFPHITLALGLGAPEADALVRSLRQAEVTAGFEVDELSLLAVVPEAPESKRYRRVDVPLGDQSVFRRTFEGLLGGGDSRGHGADFPAF